MKNVVVVGSQWGDEGKGKIVDWLSSEADVIVRFQGGHNAGHTLVIDSIVYKLRLLPSGIVRKNKISIIGNGVVVDPWALLDEIDEIKSKGVEVNPNNLILSEAATLILPFHKEMDEIREDTAGKSKIGTTRRGIGPAYEDKIGRRSIRVMDLASENNLDKRLEVVLSHHNAIRKGLGKTEFKKEQLKKNLLNIAPQILKFSQPVWKKIDEFKSQNKKILFEGAQGALLDLDHGSYPFVTSSNTVSSNIVIGSAIQVDYKTVGIFKAYATRVGNGPFPTELFDDVGDYIAEKGVEIGTVTKRKRRCGWLDLVSLKYSCEINRVNELCITKADVLNNLSEIKVCKSYNSKKYDEVNFSESDVLETLSLDNNDFESFSSWGEIKDLSSFENLPENLKKFISYIEDYLSIPIKVISLGPERNQTTIR